MKTLVKIFIIMAYAATAWAAQDTVVNLSRGIWVTQIGDIKAQDETMATLYYTLYGGSDGLRVKSVDYHYNGSGQMDFLNKDTICGSASIQGADGIAHHPDGDLLIAAQGKGIYKIKKNAKLGERQAGCMRKTVAASTGGYWHLMMDYNKKYVWATNMPGPPVRYPLYSTTNQDGIGNTGYTVQVQAQDGKHTGNNSKPMSTIIWDGQGHAFFTYSDYIGGGCEASLSTGALCSSNNANMNRAKAYFGYIRDTLEKKIIATAADSVKYVGHMGDTVVTKLGTVTLLDSLEGAHGGTYDPYSETIFVFGGSKIVQIKPYLEGGTMKAKIIAEIDLRKVFFVESKANLKGPRTSGVGYRLDQGTVDGKGHLFVACQTGHIIFVDYAANADKKIDNNVLIHMQWVDNYLDDLAPLDIEDAVRQGANTPSKISSSSVIRLSSDAQYVESSSSKNSSSSAAPLSSSVKPESSATISSSSGIPPVYSSGTNSSSSSVPVESSGSNPSSSSVVPGESSSSNPVSSSSLAGSSGSEKPGSSSAVNPSSSETPGSSETPSSSSSINTGSSSSPAGSSGSHQESSSSDNTGSMEDDDDESSSSNNYAGFEDDEDDDDDVISFYTREESYDKGDSIVKESYILIPTSSGSGPGKVVIGEQTYLISDNPKGSKLDLWRNSNLDSAKVGQVVAVTLDKEKVKQYFGDSVTTLLFEATENVVVVDPKNPDKAGKLQVNSDGSATIYVTATEAVRNGSIKIAPPGGGDGVIIDNINFYDPVPDSKMGYIKDSDDDGKLDYVEVQLEEALGEDLKPVAVTLEINGKTIKATATPTLSSDRTRVSVSVKGLSGLPASGKVPEGAKVKVTYEEKVGGHRYNKEASLVEFGSSIIKNAYAIRNSKGMDSLFVEFNVDLIPYDIRTPELLVLLNEEGFNLGQVKKAYLPSKNIVIFEGKGLGLKGDNKDSVSLYPMTTFRSMPYITSDEYDRQVTVTVVDRLPVVKTAEYWDLDKNGVLDQVVLQFEKPLTANDLSQIYATFPWYTSRGLAIQMQAQPSDFKLDPKDSTRVLWNVHAVTTLAKGVTGISETLSPATVFTYYSVFGESFVTEDAAALVDKMAPVVLGATLNYGKKADTLELAFSEPVKYQKLEGKDFFKCIHGKDTLDLMPKKIEWSTDGKSAKLIIDGSATTILPGDSLLVVRGSNGSIQDNYGNIMGENPQPVVIGGLLNHLVENTTMGTYDSDDEVLQTLSSVNLRYMPSSTTKEDMEKEGALGQLVQLGERFVPQLLDRAQISADGSVDPSVLDSLDPEKVFISFVVNYYDHLGQYVNDTLIEVPCNSPKFGGNCLNSDQKVFVNWNFKDHNGRFVGTGVYMVQFRMVVRYEKKKIEEEIKDKWGVRRKKKR